MSSSSLAGLRNARLAIRRITSLAASATVRAARHTSLLRLPKQDFDVLILSHPQVLEHVSVLIDERKKADLLRQGAEQMV